MSEYKNGVNAFGNMSVDKADYANEVHTGRAVFVDEDKYANDAKYKAKVDQCLAEGFHKVGNSEGGDEGGGGGSSDFSTAEVTINATIEGSPTLVYKRFNAVIQYPVGSFNTYTGSFEDFTGNVLLYQNEATIGIDAIYAEGSDEHLYVAVLTDTTPTTSGNATYDSENEEFIITGDCTINITMVPRAQE